MHECRDPRVDRWPMTRRNTGAIRSGDETLSETLLGACQHVSSTQTLVQYHGQARP